MDDCQIIETDVKFVEFLQCDGAIAILSFFEIVYELEEEFFSLIIFAMVD